MGKLVLNSEGIREMLRDEPIRSAIESLAADMASSLGEGYTYDIGYGSKDGRVRAFVRANSDKAKNDTLENNSLLKAVGGNDDRKDDA